jgi:CRP-like cAMP-binding protein
MLAPQPIEPLLSTVPLFSGLGPEQLARVARGTRRVFADKGDFLFYKGDPCAGFHLIIHGRIKLLLTSSQGNEKVVELLGVGQTFGEALMFAEKDYIVAAQAISDSVLLHFSKDVIFEELNRDPVLRLRMLAGLSSRVHELIVEVESLSFKTGTQRVIGYLLQGIPETGTDSHTAVILPTTKGNIASRLNLTHEHFARTLRALADSGLIQLQGSKIVIPDVKSLRAHDG